MNIRHVIEEHPAGPPVFLRAGDTLTATASSESVELRVSYDAFTTSAPVSFAQPIVHAGAPADYRFVRVGAVSEPVTISMIVAEAG